MSVLFARTNELHNQDLFEHLSNVSKLAATFSDYESISNLTGFLHDIGKASKCFQEYLLEGGVRGKVVHSLQGGFLIDELMSDSIGLDNNLLKETISLVVAAHHGSLDDGVALDGEDLFVNKLERKDVEKYSYSEIKQNVPDAFLMEIKDLIKAAKSEITSVIQLIQEAYDNKNSAQFALGLFIKYIYSCLIDADRLDAYLFENNEEFKPFNADWDKLIGTFEKNIQKLCSDSEVGKIRHAVSMKCKESAKKSTGIYQLSVATGGGKTLSSFRFALHHCKLHSKKRIIYVIPYLSIIEQTSENLREILGLNEDDGIILEHHSNIVTSEGENEEEQKIRKLTTSRWDSPIIVTTMVQFLETVMSAKAGNLRKFHNMSDAVIIFDEIQSLPIKTVHLFNETVSFLSEIRNSTILLCSATQPHLSSTERNNLLMESSPDLIDCANLFDQLKRTVIVAEPERTTNELADFVVEKAKLNGNCLVITNTKKEARELFDNMSIINDFEVYHLSTAMCQAHRRDILEKAKEALNYGTKVILVATQLIEAGVDISFACVVRVAAGLDSVIQAAGRCNRSGESDAPKEVYVVPLADENLAHLDVIKTGKEITLRLIREYEGIDLSETKILEQFYRYYLSDKESQMDYTVKDGNTIYDMLSSNKIGTGNYINRNGKNPHCAVKHAFRTADENFGVIEKNTESVVVMYKDAEKLIEAYRILPKSLVTREKLAIIKKLEKYSVSLFPHGINELINVRAIDMLDDESGIKYLNKLYYSEHVGVVTEINPDACII